MTLWIFTWATSHTLFVGGVIVRPDLKSTRFGLKYLAPLAKQKDLNSKRPPTTRKIPTPKKRPLLPLPPLHLDPARRTSRRLVIAVEGEVEQGLFPGFEQSLS
jgi:hypothetical protein